jgi:metal-responsive CopG/Arc/MetJ family transcriptional regulator
METIQVVLDAELLHATDRAARRTKVNRSALIREAIRDHLKRLAIHELEERDRKGYEKVPGRSGDLSRWESEAAWPAD